MPKLILDDGREFEFGKEYEFRKEYGDAEIF